MLNRCSGTVGSEPLDDLAKAIWSSVGPSGPNKEYMLKLAAAVRELAPESHDSHLAALEVRRLNARWTHSLISSDRNAYVHLTKPPSHEITATVLLQVVQSYMLIQLEGFASKPGIDHRRCLPRLIVGYHVSSPIT